MTPINIAITSVGSGIGQSIVDACRLSALPLTLYGYGSNPLAHGAFDCDFREMLPAINSPDYLEQLLAQCAKDRIQILIPGHDLELLLISENLHLFSELNIKVPISAPRLILLCRNKFAMFGAFREHEDIFAKTYAKSVACELVEKGLLRLPLISKPVNGFASKGVELISTKTGLMGIGEDRVLQEIVQPHENDHNFQSFQQALDRGELLQLSEISVQIVVNADGSELGRYVSCNNLQNGVPVEVTPINHSLINTTISRLLPSLVEAGLKGPINLQGRLTADGLKLFEMNARFTGITGVRALTGFNEVAAVIADLMKWPNPPKWLNQTCKRIGIRQVGNRVIPKKGLNRRILFTGANGYLGRAVLASISENKAGCELVAVVRSPSRFDENASKKLRGVSELLSFEELWQQPNILGSIDFILHLASARSSNDYPALAESLQITERLVRLAEHYQVPNFVYVSSQSVYGTKESPPWSENTPVAPETMYAQSKLASELLVKSINERHKHCRVISLRLARLFGPSEVMRLDELPHKFMRLALDGASLTVLGGSQKIDLIDVRDAAGAIAKLCTEDAPIQSGIFNLATGKPVSVLNVAQTCAEIARTRYGMSPVISIKDNHDLPSSGMRAERFQAALHWSPKFDLQTSLQDVARVLSKND